MSINRIIQRLKISPLTAWLWSLRFSPRTGQVIELPIWRKSPAGFRLMTLKD